MALGMPVEKPKNMWNTIKRIITYLGTQKYSLFALITIVILTTLLSLVMPVLQKNAIDTITFDEGINVDFVKLRFYLLCMGVLFVITSAFTLAQGLLAATVSQKTVKIIRRDMMNKLQGLPVKYFDKHTHGELMSRLTNDVDNISMSVSQSITSFISSFIMIAGSLAMMMYYSRLMTLISLAVIPAGIFVTKKIMDTTRVYFKKQQEGLGNLNGHIE
jgi:ATP-binding cassette subfamily B protein